MHYVTAKGILSAKNGMNLYRGCQHGCIYCDSRSECYHMDHDFEDIEVKENALVLLEDALRRAAVACYCVEGAYPPDLKYLEERYGIQIDRQRYTVSYVPVAENLMPDITVIYNGK